MSDICLHTVLYTVLYKAAPARGFVMIFLLCSLTFASNLVFFGVRNCRFSLSQSLMMSDDDLEASLVAKLPFCASKLVTVHE